MLAIVAPGQGAQSPGFLSPWLELTGALDRAGALSAVAGIDLGAHGTTSDAETIKDTAIAQPLIVAAGLLALPFLVGATDRGIGAAGVIAGHSVGEITAAGAAGVLTDEQAMALVSERGRAMAGAAAIRRTGMSAVLGGDPDEVAETLDRLGLTAANMNGGGQVVAAGTMDQLAALTAAPPTRTRVIPLQVAGAFHTEHMGPAVEALAALVAGMTVGDPLITLLSNADGAVVATGRQVLDRLVNQVSHPVRWDLCMETMASLGVTGLIELPPAGTLVGLARRALKGVETLALKSPDDLEAAHRMLEEHTDTAPSPKNPQEG